jgi:hypothetical protein
LFGLAFDLLQRTGVGKGHGVFPHRGLFQA